MEFKTLREKIAADKVDRTMASPMSARPHMLALWLLIYRPMVSPVGLGHGWISPQSPGGWRGFKNPATNQKGK